MSSLTIRTDLDPKGIRRKEISLEAGGGVKEITLRKGEILLVGSKRERFIVNKEQQDDDKKFAGDTLEECRQSSRSVKSSAFRSATPSTRPLPRIRIFGRHTVSPSHTQTKFSAMS